MKKKFKKGFTLVELVVVIAVIAILAAVSVGAYFGVTDSANKSKLNSEGRSILDNIKVLSIGEKENNYSLYTSKGLLINDLTTFNIEINSSTGFDLFLTFLDEKDDEKSTIYFFNKEEVVTNYYTYFKYYSVDVSKYYAEVNLINNEIKIIEDNGNPSQSDEEIIQNNYSFNTNKTHVEIDFEPTSGVATSGKTYGSKAMNEGAIFSPSGSTNSNYEVTFTSVINVKEEATLLGKGGLFVGDFETKNAGSFTLTVKEEIKGIVFFISSFSGSHIGQVSINDNDPLSINYATNGYRQLMVTTNKNKSISFKTSGSAGENFCYIDKIILVL